MLQINNKTITIIENVALYFFVICFSLSNISLFNMVLSYAGYQGDVTLISSIIYAFLNLFILVFFIYYVLSHKQYKMLLIIFLINIVYIFPHLINFTIKGIALYLMFPLPFSLFGGIIAVDPDIRKKLVDVFYKLRYVYSILGIAYICFLAFLSEGNRGSLIDFTYGNVAWVFLPPIFVYIGLIIQKDFFRKSEYSRYKEYELLGILLLLEITVFYTGLRSGIISLLFAKFLFLIGFLITDFKQKKNYIINFLILLSVMLITFLISTNITLEKSRMNIISNQFLFESKIHEVNKEKTDKKPSSDKSDISETIEIEDLYKYVNKIKREEDSIVAYPYVKEPTKILDAETDNIIGQLEKGTYVDGVKEDRYVYFNFNGKKAKLSQEKLIFAKPKWMYVTAQANIRNEDMEKVGKAYKGKSIYAVLIGDYYRYWENGICFIHKDFVQEELTSINGYTLGSSNIREIDTEQIVDKYNIGTYIEGIEKGEYVFIINNNMVAKIHRSRLSFQTPKWFYINSIANVRNDQFKIVGNSYIGKPILAVRFGDYYRYWENGTKFIHRLFVQSKPIAAHPSITAKYKAIDAKDNETKTVELIFMENIIYSDQAKTKTENILHEDVIKNSKKYLIVKDQYRTSVAEYSVGTDRYNLWYTAFGEFKKSPLIGQGALFYQTKYDEFFPHNIILEILTDFGIIGLIITMSIAILLIYKSIKYIRQKKDKSMLLILVFGLSYIPAYLLYNSLYSDNSLAFLITLLATYVIVNKEKNRKIEKKLGNK